MFRTAQEPPNLAFRQRFRRAGMGAGAFHFDENNFSVFLQYQVNFTGGAAPAAGNKPVAMINVDAQRAVFCGLALEIGRLPP